MKNLLTSCFLITASLAWSQADNWEPIVTDGFASGNANYGAVELEVFHDTVFAGTGRLGGPGAAELWYSPSGSMGDWTLVTNYNPPLPQAYKSLHSINKTDLDGGIMWIGTGSPTAGSMIYRSIDGLNWNLINQAGWGNPQNAATSPEMVVYQGTADSIPYLYAGTGSHGGTKTAEVWRIPYNSSNPNDWERLMDFDTVATTISDSVNLITYFNVWNGKLLFTTNGKGQLWESTDGVTFTQNASVGYGFGSPTSIAFACMQQFHDSLFISTTNKATGGHMYRTGDGVVWDTLTMDGFGWGPAAEELHNMDTAFGKLWVTAYTDTTYMAGVPVWRSGNGWNFVQSNLDGFGNIANDGANPVLISHQGKMYCGAPNFADGAQIWRTTTTLETNTELEACEIRLYPNPVVDITRIDWSPTCAEWSSLEVFDVAGRIIDSQTIVGDVLKWDRDQLPAGTYIYVLSSPDGLARTGKIMVK